MQTLTVTAARKNLGGWLKRAAAGEEIGVLVGDKVVAFRPVAIMAADYAETEYRISPADMDQAAARIVAEARAGAAAGEFTPYTPGQFARENRAVKKVRRFRPKARAQ